MVHTGIYATSDECIKKAGADYDSTNVIEATINAFCLQAEGEINSFCTRVFAVDSTAFSALSSTTKGLLSQATSNLVAIYMLEYSMKDVDSIREAENRINILRDGYLRAIGMLRDKEVQRFLVATHA